MIPLSQIISRIPPSPTLAASEKASVLKSQGRDIVSLTVGEPDFDTPQHIKDAASEALRKGFTKYVAVQGILPLREVISAKFKRDQGLEYSPKEIIVTNGGKQSLAACCAVLLNPGDEVVIPAPYWTSFPDMAKLVGAKPVIVPTSPDNGYIMSPEAMLSACGPKTKMIVLNSPSNPSGASYTKEELLALVEAFKTLKNRDEIVILSDEVYEYITYDGFEHTSIAQVAPELRENIVISNAFSKAYAMTGWRVGYAAGPRHIIEAMSTHQGQFTSNVCSIAQYAASKAYEDQGEFPRLMKAEFAKRLDLVWSAVEAMPGVKVSMKPRGAFYAFLEIDELLGRKVGSSVINCGMDFANYLLNEFDVVVVQGEAFGSNTAVRLSFALATDQLVKGLERIHSAADRLYT